MAYVDRTRNQDRAKALVGAVVLQAVVGYAFITGLGYQVATAVSENLKVFDVREPPPPPEEPPPPAKPKAKDPEGAAAPKSMKAIVAPKPRVRLPVKQKVPTVPVAGTSNVRGEGTGSGGVGTGTGSGGSGSGTGGGGGSRAQRVRGKLAYEDLPRAARQRQARGSVGVRFVVEPDGRATGCRVTRSSGDSILDSTTCSMIERRFIYRPARNAQGNPVAETISTAFEWIPTVRP